MFLLSFLSNLSKKYPNEKITFRQQVSICDSDCYIKSSARTLTSENVNPQVIVWWAGLMRGAVSIALAYNQVGCSFLSTKLNISLIL